MGLKQTIVNTGKDVMADMGLKGALLGSVKGTLADQWKEYFYCDAMSADTLMVKGTRRVSDRSANTKGSDNIITSGSVVAVADGQCMIIVDQGRIAELCAQPGEFIYDASAEPSVFAGDLGPNIIETFKTMGRRITFGGETGRDQRVYYINTKEIIGNKYGTPNPVPFRVVDTRAGLDLDISIRCFGEYSYRISNPILFYTNVCANVTSQYKRETIDSQLKTEVMTALQPAFGKISAMGIRYSALPGHTMELANAMNEVLSEKWAKLRGIEMVSFGVSSVKASEDDEKLIRDMQRTAAYRDPGMGAAYMVQSQGEAMKAAAANQNAGPAMAFMGMNMAAQAGGVNAQSLYQMAAQQPQQPAPAPQPKAEGTWKCACGRSNTGKFCAECGSKKPQEGWKCSCGNVNKGKFCTECGARRPAGAPVYRCDKCGWEPADPKNPPKFCAECGDPFNDEDASSGM